MSDSNELAAVQQIALPPVLDAAAAADLKPGFVAALAAGGVQVEAGEVQRATTQGLQLLAVAARSYAAEGAAFGFGTVAEPLREACTALGLASLLGLEGE